jgi:molybdopterin synthase sulfur carrier subunit
MSASPCNQAKAAARATVRIEIPAHLRTLARVDGEVRVEIEGVPTLCAALDALEARYPMLRGTIRDRTTLERRAFIRYFACMEDWSHLPTHTPLPEPVIAGGEPLLIIGAIAGGV